MGFFDTASSLIGSVANNSVKKQLEVARQMKRDAERKGDYEKARRAQEMIDKCERALDRY